MRLDQHLILTSGQKEIPILKPWWTVVPDPPSFLKYYLRLHLEAQGRPLSKLELPCAQLFGKECKGIKPELARHHSSSEVDTGDR